jgi:hypothetical protein
VEEISFSSISETVIEEMCIWLSRFMWHKFLGLMCADDIPLFGNENTKTLTERNNAKLAIFITNFGSQNETLDNPNT